MYPSRRKVLLNSVKVALAGGACVQLSAAYASAEEAQAAFDAFVGEATTKTGTITLTTPEIAENGHAVPISVFVESPMTEQSYVESVMILAEDNPNPEVATFHFTPASGVARVSTRIRLARTQNVIAIAKMKDGSVFTDSRNVKVTIGGCGA